MPGPGNNRGEDNFKSKLSRGDVTQIYLDKTCSQSQLAARYRVSQATINHIKNQKTWKWLTDELEQEDLE